MPKFLFPVIALAGVLISGSRSAFFFILVGLTVFLLNKKVPLRYRVAVIGIIILAIFVPSGTLVHRLGEMGQHVGELFSGSDFLGTLDEVTNNRVVMLQRWSDALKKFPLSGVGAGNFLFYYRFQNFGRAVYEDLPLNQYLQVAIETGFIGLLAFVYFLFALWRSQRRRMERIVLAAILVILCVNTAFWLPECILLFFLFAAGAGNATSPGPRASWRTPVALVMLLVFAIANAAAFTALHPVTWAKKCRSGYAYGLFPVERDSQGAFQWSASEAGFYLVKGEAAVIGIRCAAPLDRLPGRAQSIDLYWNGERSASRLFTRNETWVVPVDGREGFMEIRVSPAFSPLLLKISHDPRRFGVQLLYPLQLRP
jgi:hypothetical protein